MVVFSACLPSFDIVCDEFDDGVWNVCLCEFVNEKVYVHCVESFAHVEGHGNSALWRFWVIKTAGDVMAYVM